MPEAEPTEATAGLLLVQAPPAVAEESVVVEPEHKAVTPVIGAGNGLTVTVVVAKQPVDNT